MEEDKGFPRSRLHIQHEVFIFANFGGSLREANKQNTVGLGNASLGPGGIHRRIC